LVGGRVKKSVTWIAFYLAVGPAVRYFKK